MKYIPGIVFAACVIYLAAAMPVRVAACGWDTDTLRDELQSHADVFDLITGQFPQHSRTYYEARVRTSEAKLRAYPNDRIARNDLAVALIYLGRFDEAEVDLRRLDELKPNHYETLSNLGVLFKDKGNFAKAHEYISRALKIKADGHLGAGDLYTKMLRYHEQTARLDGNAPDRSFLGHPYVDGPWDSVGEGLAERVDDELFNRVKGLVKAERTFADGLLVLGDMLLVQRNTKLALWAYVRALHLNHPAPAVIRQRIHLVFEANVIGTIDAMRREGVSTPDRPFTEAPNEWKKAIVQLTDITIERITVEFLKTDAWLTTFQEIEAELVSRGEQPDFATIEAELQRRGIERYRPDHEFLPDPAFEAFIRGLDFAEAGRHREAIAAYTEAIKLNPNDARFYNHRGASYGHVEDLDKTIADFKQALSIEPFDARIQNNLGVAYHHRGKTAQAITQYTEAIQSDSSVYSPYYNRGRAHLEQGKIEEAIDDLTRAIKLNAQYAPAYDNRGAAFGRKGRFAEAIADFDRSIELDPKNATAYRNRGTAQFQLKRYQQALKDYNESIRLDPANPSSYIYRAYAWQALGNAKHAELDRRKAEQLKGENQ